MLTKIGCTFKIKMPSKASTNEVTVSHQYFFFQIFDIVAVAVYDSACWYLSVWTLCFLSCSTCIPYIFGGFPCFVSCLVVWLFVLVCFSAKAHEYKQSTGHDMFVTTGTIPSLWNVNVIMMCIIVCFVVQGWVQSTGHDMCIITIPLWNVNVMIPVMLALHLVSI